VVLALEVVLQRGPCFPLCDVGFARVAYRPETEAWVFRESGPAWEGGRSEVREGLCAKSLSSD
jgi:hypothetical protein